jgi:hypothetical protein
MDYDSYRVPYLETWVSTKFGIAVSFLADENGLYTLSITLPSQKTYRCEISLREYVRFACGDEQAYMLFALDRQLNPHCIEIAIIIEKDAAVVRSVKNGPVGTCKSVVLVAP